MCQRDKDSIKDQKTAHFQNVFITSQLMYMQCIWNFDYYNDFSLIGDLQKETNNYNGNMQKLQQAKDELRDKIEKFEKEVNRKDRDIEVCMLSESWMKCLFFLRLLSIVQSSQNVE